MAADVVTRNMADVIQLTVETFGDLTRLNQPQLYARLEFFNKLWKLEEAHRDPSRPVVDNIYKTTLISEELYQGLMDELSSLCQTKTLGRHIDTTA